MRRTILHIDMNSYFASCEQQANPHLRGKPVVVSGEPKSRTVIAAASIEAKRFGIESGMTVSLARRLCPHLVFVLGDPAKYRSVTERFLKIFQDYTPLLEIFSIDEVFLDVTDTCEYFGGAQKIAQDIKERLKKEIGEWFLCSIGIAPNKLLAKLASNMQKPDGLVIISQKDISKTLEKIKLTDLCGIGERIKLRLAKIGIRTVKELGTCPVKKLVKEFGALGYVLSLMGKGKDSSRVVPYYEMPEEKSMSHCYTLPYNLSSKDEVKKVIFNLSEKIARRLRRKNFVGRTVSLTLRFSDFSCFHKQRTVSCHIFDGLEIYQIALQILQGIQLRKSVRMVGVAVSNIFHTKQSSLLLPFRKKEKLFSVLDKINSRFGEWTITRASLLSTRKLVEDICGEGRKKQFEV